MDWDTDAVGVLEECVRADPDAACWRILVSWSVFEGWRVVPAGIRECAMPNSPARSRGHWSTSWAVPGPADARLRLAIPDSHWAALKRYLSTFQEDHVAATGGLADGISFRFELHRDHTELFVE